MSPYLYNAEAFSVISPAVIDFLVAGIGMGLLVMIMFVMPSILLRYEQKQQEVQKTHKKQLLQSLVTMKSLEDELENEMKEALIARAVRNLPTR